MRNGKQTILRVTSNYARMVGTFLFGLWLVRLLLGLGSDAYSVILLLGAGQGITAILKDMARASLVPALGAAYHRDDGQSFRGAYNSALVICFGAALLTAVSLVGLAAALPTFQIPSELIPAARLFVIMKGIQACSTLLLSPTFHMYVVSERMVAYNFWVLLERVADTLAALVVLALVPAGDSFAAIVQFGAWSTTLGMIVLLSATGTILFLDRRLIPHLGTASREQTRQFMQTGQSNCLIVLANNLYFRSDALIVNAFFGLFGNLVFGVASQFVSYTRMIALGLVTGLDAVTARIAVHDGSSELRKLVLQSTRIQGLVVFPVATVLFVLTRPLTELWLGNRLEDPAQSLPQIVAMVRILIVGLSARAAGDAWIGILSGAGRLRELAWIVTASGIVNVCLVTVLAMSLPDRYALQAPGWAYTPLSFIVYGILTPLMLKWRLGVSLRSVYLPLAGPLILSLAGLPILLWGRSQLSGEPIELVLVIGMYTSCYAASCLVFLLTSGERQMLLTLLRRLTARQQQDVTSRAQSAQISYARTSQIMSTEMSGSLSHDRDAVRNSQSDSDRMARAARQVFFLVGCGRSGTSLLRAVVSAHPQAFAVNETQFCHVIYRKNHRALRHLSGEKFIDAAMDRTFRYWWIQELQLDRQRVRELAVAGGCTWASLLLSLMIVRTNEAQLKAIGDKSPADVGYTKLLDQWFPHGKTIHIVRDPRAVLASFRKTNFGPTNLVAVARQWRNAVEQYQNRLAVEPRRHLLLRYEDLTSRPDIEQARICEFLGLPESPEMAQYHLRSDPGFSPHKMGHMANTLKPVFTSSVEKWKHELSRTDIALVEHICGRWMPELGYDLTGHTANWVNMRINAGSALSIWDRGRAKWKWFLQARALTQLNHKMPAPAAHSESDHSKRPLTKSA